MPKAPVPQPVPDQNGKPETPAQDRQRREDSERERQDERAFPDREPAQKKTGEF